MSTTTTPPFTSTSLWFEETVSGLTSAFLARGPLPGYGPYFSNMRIIGIKKRRLPLMVSLGVDASFFGLLFYLTFYTPISSPYYLLTLILPLFSHLLAPRTLYIPDRIIARHKPETTSDLGSKRDFEIRRQEIAELLMKPPSFWERGYLRITTENFRGSPKTIRIAKKKQFLRVRDLVIAYASKTPTVRAVEYH